MAGELLGTGYVEIKPRLDAFKAELNAKGKSSLENGIEKPAEKANESVERLLKTAKKVSNVKKPDQFKDVEEDVKGAVLQANLFNDELEEVKSSAKEVAAVDLDDNLRKAQKVAGQLPLAFKETEIKAKAVRKEVSGAEAVVKKTVLQSKLLATAQEAARKEADRLELSATDSAAAIKEATQQATRMSREIDKSTDNANDFEDAIERATRAIKQGDKAWDQITDEVLESVRANEKFKDSIEDSKAQARELQTRMAKVASETDEVGDEAARAESKIKGARVETDKWANASRGVRTAVAGIVAGLGVREIVQGLREATTAAVDFEGGLNEVFTLIPGVNDQLRMELGEGVRDVAREFGQLPEDAVPALYNALSAGVPPDNVLTFLETASKLAVGGVTDLNSGVNILTTAVNSYNSVLDENGNQYLDAALASDILFTTVRLGKTNIDQLNASLGQVLPTAAATGLKFEDVGAALAVLTANGLNTPRATTALNASLVELNKEGTRAFNLFEQAAGQTFPEFIESGGQLNEGLRLLQEEAEATGTSILDVFPVEAARGALALTNNIDSLDAATAEFNDTAGATEAAFAEVFQGDAFAVQQATAAFEDLKIELGQALLPTVAAVAREFVDLYKAFLEGGFDGFLDGLREIAPATTMVIEKLADVAQAVADFLSGFSDSDLLGSIFGENFTIVDGIIASLAAGAALIGTAIIGFVGPVVAGAFGTVFSGLLAPFAASIVGFGSLFTGIGGTIIGAFGGVAGFLGTLTSAFGAVATTIGSGGILGAIKSLIPSFGTLATSGLKILTFFNPLVLIGGLLVAAFVKLAATNEGFRSSLANLLPLLIGIGQSIADVVLPVAKQLGDAFLNDIIPAFEPVVEVIVSELLPAILMLVDAIVTNLLPVFLGGLVFAFTTVLPLIAKVAAFVLELLVPALAAIVTWVAENVIPAIAELVMWFRENLVPTIVEVGTWIAENLVPAFLSLSGFIVDDVIPAISDLFGWWQDNILPILQDVGNEIVNTLNPALTAIAEFIESDVIPAVQELYNWWQQNILPVLQAVSDFITGTVLPALGQLSAWIASEVVPSLETLWGWLQNNILPVLQAVASFAGGQLMSALGLLASTVGTVLVVAFRSLWNVISTFVLPVLTTLIGIVVGSFQTAFQGAVTVINGFKSGFDTLKTAIKGVITTVTSLISKIQELGDSGIGGIISGAAGAASSFLPLAEGGIVTSPTSALIGEDGPEVVVPLGPERRDRLFELAKASGLTDIILNNVAQVEATPSNPSNTELAGLSRAITGGRGSSEARGLSGGTAERSMVETTTQEVTNNFSFEAQGVTMEEVLDEGAQRAAAEFRSAKVGC